MSDIDLYGKFLAALVFVLALIGLCAWLFRRFGGAMRLGRQGRLGLVETIAIDSRRRLVLVRRDRTEHLLLIGGPQDLVIEAGIDVMSEPPVGAARGTAPPRHGRAEPSFATHLPDEKA
jgi:flagellar protein FliO/FliZ